jgi:exonuclease III
LNASVSPKFSNNTLLCKDRPQGRRGRLAFLIHHTVQFSPIDTSSIPADQTECQAIRATINGSDVSIFNVYFPPVSLCSRNYCPDLSSIVNFADEDLIVCGDLNAHHARWDSSLSDPRSENITDAIENSP